MKTVRFLKDKIASYGILQEDKIVRIDGDLFGNYQTTNEVFCIDEVSLLAPCNPTKVVAVGLNYRDHIEEFHHEVPTEPVIFLKPSTAIVGDCAFIEIPRMATRVDYEAELAIVIGKLAKNVKKENAMDYIFGYTCFNDITERDIQKKDGQWTRAKGFDTFAPIGPCIATDVDANNLDIKLILNGEVRQQSNTSNFLFDIATMVSFVSSVMTLYPGDTITTGTPSGIGALREGDKVVVSIDGIGELTNFVKKIR